MLTFAVARGCDTTAPALQLPGDVRATSASGPTPRHRTVERRSPGVRSNGPSPLAASRPRADGVGGTVPATLSLSLGSVPSLGAFTPGTAATYDASTIATVTSTAGDAALSVSDPSSIAPGHLVNGAFSLASPLHLRAGAAAFAPLGSSPLALLSYSGPVSNDSVTIGIRQAIAANEPLRTGTYGKTLTFTLSTTRPSAWRPTPRSARRRLALPRRAPRPRVRGRALRRPRAPASASSRR